MSATVPEVLFLCVHNAGRSQMAAALLAEKGGDGVVVRSAGSEPADKVNPAVQALLAERGIDVSGRTPTKLTDDMARAVDIVVTMGCGDACPVYPGKRYVDWSVPDPDGLSVDQVRPILAEIEQRVDGLLAELGLPTSS